MLCLQDKVRIFIIILQLLLFFVFQAFNNVGAGPQSPVVKIFSAEDMPQVQPTAVGAWPLNATSINITWQPIEASRDNIRGELIGYRVSSNVSFKILDIDDIQFTSCIWAISVFKFCFHLRLEKL